MNKEWLLQLNEKEEAEKDPGVSVSRLPVTAMSVPIAADGLRMVDLVTPVFSSFLMATLCTSIGAVFRGSPVFVYALLTPSFAIETREKETHL